MDESSNKFNLPPSKKSILAKVSYWIKFFSRNLTNYLRLSLNSDSNGTTYAMISYFPFLGPLITFLFKRKNDIANAHALNAIYLQVVFTTICLIIWLLENFPLINTLLKVVQFTPFITNAISYLNTVALIACSLYGLFMAQRGEKWRVPFLYNFVDRIWEKGKKELPFDSNQKSDK